MFPVPALAVEAPRFVEDTAGAGVDHAYDGGKAFYVGGGAAAFDCDGDGRSDLYLAGGTNKSALYRNISVVGGPLRFKAVEDGVVRVTHVIGAYPLDIDGDGIRDLAVLRVGENLLLRGLGSCRFERANEAWAFDGGEQASTAFSACWENGADWPTVAVGNYVDPTREVGRKSVCDHNLLYRPARGRLGFGTPLALRPGYCALSMLFTDWNRSGYADLRISNDRHYGGQEAEEQLWRVRPNQTPRAYSREDGWSKLRIWGMGIATHDITGDDYPEFFLTSMGDSKLRTLKGNAERPDYRDTALQLGATAHRPFAGGDVRPSTGWHAEFADFNNDGHIDLFVTKGNVEAMGDFAQRDPNNLLLGQADGPFVESAEDAGLLSFRKARGTAIADFNLDGFLDLVVVNRGDKAQLWRNVTGTGNWLSIELEQPKGNRHGIGARIEVRAGSRLLRREVTVGGGHAGGSTGWTHIGLGTATRADVRVRWPYGQWSDWGPMAANRFWRLARQTERFEQWSPPDN
jgi:hypothetical protein